MSTTWSVWLASLLPIVGLCVVMVYSSFFLFPKQPAVFLRLLAAFVFPWIILFLLRYTGLHIDNLIAFLVSLGCVWTTQTRKWPLWAGFGAAFLLIILRFAEGATLFSSFISVLVGALGGLAVVFLHNRYNTFERIVRIFQTEMEYRRQTMHLLVGVSITLGMYFGILHTVFLGILIPISLVFIHLLKKRKLSFLEKVLLVFERKHHFEKFPGRGSLCFLIGSFLASFLFTPGIAMASVIILAFGDSITNIAGGYFGKIPLPYNTHKNIEGPAAGALIAAIAASIFVPFPVALIASIGAMFVETLPLRFNGWDIDDNITIPVVAGMIMTMFL